VTDYKGQHVMFIISPTTTISVFFFFYGAGLLARGKTTPTRSEKKNYINVELCPTNRRSRTKIHAYPLGMTQY
jgi:hypothetical protein